MPHKYYYRKITNSDVQKILTVNAQCATYLLNKIRTAYGKISDDHVRMWEFCEHEKLDIDKVCLILGLTKE